MIEPAAPLRDVAIIGGGCYGSFYAGQLEAACRKGKLALRRVLVVDRDPECRAARELAPFPGREIVVADWETFLDTFLDAAPPGEGEPDDAVVPSPLMPHLMAGWLQGLVRRGWPGRAASLVSPDIPLGTPYDALGPDGTRYVSFADWICPTHCVEPLTCPMIRAPRTWEMGDSLARYTERLDQRRPTRGPALFTTRHHAFGVGMFHAAEIRASRHTVEEAGRTGDPVEIVVGTISACHGAVSVLRLGATAAD
ncbi:MAG TPA: hypothetical protein VGP87_15780 [Gemmatimonadales bacterium]|jgi:hypothetical protein|nr:hypothetical protein [Gemmatimonadales bacterium]